MTAAREHGSTLLRVRDHGRGMPNGMRRGTGLSNTAERLAQLYGERPPAGIRKLRRWRLAGDGGLPLPDMIRVLIVDDEPPARRKVRRFLERDAEIGAIAEAGSGAEAIDAIRAFAPDLVFLDVQMPDMDGFAVLAAIPEPHEFHVVFLTAHDHHALRAFEAEALGLSAKAGRSRALRARAGTRQGACGTTPRTRAEARTGAIPQAHPRRKKRPRDLPAGGALGLGGIRPQLRSPARGPSKSTTIRETLENLARQLDPEQFARISRSELVNLDRIKEMQPWFHGERRIVLARRPRIDVDAPVQGLFIPRLGPLVPGALALAAPQGKMRVCELSL